MDDSLPTDVAKLQAMLLQSRQQVSELSTTVEEQRGKLETAQQQIVELLRALRGKQRERLDPDQMLLFEIGELETLLNELAEEAKPSSPRNRKRKRGRRLIPDDAPREERVYELPEAERLCPHDGRVMPLIRYEISNQLDYVPPQVKVVVHKRAVYGNSLPKQRLADFSTPGTTVR